MKPSPTLIPRLIPIFKHSPEVSLIGMGHSSSSSTSSFTPIQHRRDNLFVSEEKVNEGGKSWNTWWLSNPPKKGNDVKARNDQYQKPNDHSHTQTSLRYHAQNPLNVQTQNPNQSRIYHQNQLTSSSPTYNSGSKAEPQNTHGKSRSNPNSNPYSKSTVKGKEKSDERTQNSTVPPPTIAWNDYLSMV